jgi:hypothetical protein
MNRDSSGSLTQAHQPSLSQLRLYVYVKAAFSFLQLVNLAKALEKHLIEFSATRQVRKQLAGQHPRMFAPTRSLQSITAVHPNEAPSNWK